MFKQTLTRLATHAPRKPSIHFPDRSITHPHHSPSPHPFAPQSIIDAFPAFLARLERSSPRGASLQKTTGGTGAGKGFDSASPEAEWEGEWELPQRFQRSNYVPGPEEIEAVLSGGATDAPPVDREYQQKWWTAQV